MFGQNLEAVVAVKGDTIKYFNKTAEQMIPGIETMSPTDIFPAQLLSQQTNQFTTETDIAGINAFVTMTSFEDCRIYSIVEADLNWQDDASNMFTALSMELKNNLAILKMAGSLLNPIIEEYEDPKIERYTSMINHTYYSILRIAENIGDLHAIIHEDLSLACSAYDIVSTTRDLVNTVGHMVQKRGVTLRFETVETSLIVYADRFKIDKMILNLLTNSVKYTPDGGLVQVILASSEDRFVITVQDTGAGITPDVLATIWNRYSVTPKMSAPTDGIGLGLTIVQTIARRHGGSAVLESSPGQGTRITVSIPLNAPEDTLLKSPKSSYETNGMQQFLTELSDVIDHDKYAQKYLD